ncbi:MAG: cytochrome c-550 PedF [Janthinobacterium sp.]|jgi:cytochrome c-550 PedF
MQKLKALQTLRTTAIGLLLVSMAVNSHAHGDVTPQPVDTTGLKALGTDWLEANPYSGNEQAIKIGAVGYLHNCAGCHGLNAISGGIAPDLLQFNKGCARTASAKMKASCMKDNDTYFKDITLKGKKTSAGRYTMPAYEEVFTQEAVWAIKSYIEARTAEELAKQTD